MEIITVNSRLGNTLHNITRQKYVPHFYKWRVQILATGGGHISTCLVETPWVVFCNKCKKLSINLVIKAELK